MVTVAAAGCGCVGSDSLGLDQLLLLLLLSHQNKGSNPASIPPAPENAINQTIYFRFSEIKLFYSIEEIGDYIFILNAGMFIADLGLLFAFWPNIVQIQYYLIAINGILLFATRKRIIRKFKAMYSHLFR